jgi:hypothetical protein
MKRILIPVLSVFLILPAAFAQTAADEEEFEAVPAPPDLPDPLESGQPIEPEVTIIRREKEVVEEYRINGNLYMVKITPVVGKPYYLIDRDGDGRLESRRTGIYDDGQVPQWVLFSW